jgi:hypothetical protein
MKNISIYILFFLCLTAKAQQDSINLIEYSVGFKFKDGVYFSHNNLLNNTPLSPENIVSPELNSSLWFEEIVKHKSISYFDEFGNLTDLQVSDLWGYCRNGRPYIYWAGTFNLIPYIGRVAHFVATIRVVYDNYSQSPFYDPYYYHRAQPARYQDELRQYLIDFDMGTVIDFNAENTAIILKRDSSLYQEFSKLRKRKKNKMMFYYIRQFNERNPLLMPLK